MRGQESMATMILWLARAADWPVVIRTLGIFFSAATKMCLLEPVTGLGCSMPQYCRHFLLRIPTTLPETWSSRDLTALFIRLLALSRVSPGS